MRKIMLIIWLLVAILPTAAQDQESEVVIKLERTMCFGSCPAYKINIHADGKVDYFGPRKHIYSAVEKVNIGPEGVEQLLEGIEAAGYFDLEDSYSDYNATDNPAVITSVTRNGITKKIYHYLGDFTVPLELHYIEHWIDRVAKAPPWLDWLPPIPSRVDAGNPYLLLDRSSCADACPAYMVVIHADGTVAYLGFANVATIGLRFAYISADEVTALVDEIRQLGYFEMVDEYIEQDTPDLSTVKTFAYEREYYYQSVVHYLGDSDAPEALTQIEAIIENAIDISEWITAKEQ